MGEGFEAFFTGDGFLVVGIYTKKEFLTTTVISSPFRDQEWVWLFPLSSCFFKLFDVKKSFPSI